VLRHSLAAATVACAVAPVLRGQTVNLATDVSMSGDGIGGACAVAPSVTTAASVDGPRLSADIATSLSHDAARAAQAQGHLRLSLRSLEWNGLSLGAYASATASNGMACRAPDAGSGTGASLTYRGAGGGIWIGLRSSAATPALRPAPPPGLSLGAWRRAGDFVLSVALGRNLERGTTTSTTHHVNIVLDTVRIDSLGQPVVVQRADTISERSSSPWAISRLDARARIGWMRGRWAANVSLGSALAAGRRPVAWGDADASFALTPGLAMVGGVVASPDQPAVGFPGRRLATLGFRLRSAPRPLPRDDGERGLASAFAVHPEGRDWIRLAVRAASARHVDVTGDFTGWSARSMQRVDDGWWELRVRLPAGTYRINVRVDGTAWRAPPGVPSVPDEFGGRVGVLVVR
jgi:hypothetical protein